MENTIYKVDHRYNPTRPSTDPSTPFSYRAQIEQLLMQRTTSHQTKKPIEMKKDSFDLIMEEDLARQVELLEMQEAEQPSKHICNPAVATAPASQPSTPESRQDTKRRGHVRGFLSRKYYEKKHSQMRKQQHAMYDILAATEKHQAQTIKMLQQSHSGDRSKKIDPSTSKQ